MEKELLTGMVLNAWYAQNKRIDTLIDKLSDEQLQAQVAPNRNRGIYLLGHLAAVSDLMLPLLDLGPALRPDLHASFVGVADRAVEELPSIAELRKYWKDITATLNEHFSKLPADTWLTKHTAVSDEDFKNEPTRNKLNIIISRTNHHTYHFGQLAFLQPKA